MSEIVAAQENAAADKLKADKAKLEVLERQLGITSSKESKLPSSAAAGPSSSSASSSSSSLSPPAEASKAPEPASQPRHAGQPDPDLVKLAQKRKKFDDDTHFEKSREINDSVRNAVAAGMSSICLTVSHNYPVADVAA